MKHFTLLIVMTSLVISSCTSTKQETLEERIGRISRAEMESVSELLGHDLFEGRAPGTRGGDLAEVTMQGLYKLLDLAPGVEYSYFQPFVMTGFSNSGFEVKDKIVITRVNDPGLVNPGWELEGMKQTIKFALLLIDQINQMERVPQMKNDVSFPMG